MTIRARPTAVVGFGRVAAGYAADAAMAKHYSYASHAQVLRAHPAFDWRAAVDPSPEARESAGSHWKVADVAASAVELGSRHDIEVAILAMPPGDARLAALQAFPNLRAVIVEKPLGGTPAEAKAFLAACAKRDITVQVNLWRRADRGFRALAEGGLTTAIGKLQTGMAVYGNGLHNNGVHIVDAVRMLCGEIVQVQALGTASGGPHLPLPGDVQVAAVLTLQAGPVIFLAPLDFRAYREVGIDLWGAAGRLAIWQEGLYMAAFERRPNRAMTGEHEVASDTPQTLASTVGEAFYALYDDLARALDGGGSICSPGASALVSEAVVAAIVESARTGTPQPLKQP